jgi:hypothetical protein
VHKDTITNCYQCKRLLHIRFGAKQKNKKQQKYDGYRAPTEHVEACRILWKMTPPEEWNHHFIHTLEGIPTNWYTYQELRKGTTTWTTLQHNFTITFSFKHENPNIDAALKQIRGFIFIKGPDIEVITEEKQWNKHTLKELLSYYHVQEEAPGEDDPCNIQIEEEEGERDVKVPPIESKVISSPIKVKKVNIGTVEHPKMASIGDYWDEETVESITELLRKYNDLFPTTFTEMKGIAGELGEMNIPLRPEARPIR